MGLDVTAERERLKTEGEIQAAKLKKEAEARRQQQIKAAEAERGKMAEEINKNFDAEAKTTVPRRDYQIDCHACKLPGGMAPGKIRRFTGIVYMSGVIITVPSVLGIIAALVALPFDTFPLMQRILGATFMICISIAMGVVGWLLTSKRPVFLCRRCGFVLDRTTE